MTTIIGASLDADGHQRSFVDTNTSETVLRLQPVILDEDFLGAGHAVFPTQGTPSTGYPWVQRTVKSTGSPTVAVVANSAAGIVALTLDATSEKQEATLYANDQRNWDVTKNLTFEARVAFGVLPTAAVEVVAGLQSAWVDGPDNAGFYIRFQALASGLLNMQTKDGVNTISASTGVTLAAGSYAILAINASDPTDVRFFVNGARVSTTGQFSFAATGGSAVLQPYASVYKASGVGIGTLNVDMVQASADRV